MQRIKERLKGFARKAAPANGLNSKKYEAELAHWKSELKHLKEWFIDGTTDWWGLAPPKQEQKITVSDLWAVNAVMTKSALRPTYTERLGLERNSLKGKRVLEVGCGPMAPIL